MEINCNDLDTNFLRNYDICVIGAGAAGLTLVNELAGNGLKICLLESGGFQLDYDTQNLYDFENTGIPRKPHIETRLRMFGGTTNHWTGRCGPFDPMDFEKRNWVPHSGWPITYTDIQPYYTRAAEYCDLKTYPFDSKIADDKYIPLPEFAPDTLHYHLWQFSKPTRFGTKYRNIVQDKNDIDLIYFANVTEIVASENTKHVTTVNIKSLQGVEGSINAKRYILCSGGIENARILLNSNSVISAGLGNHNDQVGRYFMEHPRSKHITVPLGNRKKLPYTFNDYHWKEGKFLLGMKTTSIYQKSNQTLNSGYWYVHRYSKDSTLSHLRNMVKNEDKLENKADDLIHVLNNTDDLYLGLRRRFFAPGAEEADAPEMTLVTETEQAPNPDSRITLSDDIDELGLAKSKINWQLTELDRHNIESSLRLSAMELAKSFNVRLRLPSWMEHNEPGWQNNFTDVSHHMGTTRMSHLPSTGVVDSNCKVHDIDNLYIAGGSVFATSSHINPTFTIVALSTRLADHIKELIKV